MRGLRWAWIGAAVFGVAACGGEDGGVAADAFDAVIPPADTAGLDAVEFDTRLPPLDIVPTDTLAPVDSSLLADTAADTSGGCGGAFGCACNGNSDCVDELCVDGADGRVCTRTCVADCPDGFDCVSSTACGPDPITLCIPRPARLCRPCRADADCQDAADPFPAYCLPAPDATQGSFCGSSCAGRPCPEGHTCESVTLPLGGVAKQCVPVGGAQCTCRPAWNGLGFTTTCSIVNGIGACEGVRTCGPFGLTPCDGPQAASEICNGFDDDCNGTDDDIPPTSCQVQNVYGTCPGTYRCGELGPVCDGASAEPERCDGVDNNCNGAMDEGGCDDGLSCTADQCLAPFDCRHTLVAGFCAINGACYVSGAVNPNNPCEACNPLANSTGWTQAANTCLIAGACFPNGGVNPANACQICDVNQAATSWTTAGNTCTIAGQCYASGAVNPSNSCQICAPAQSATAWSQALSTCIIQGQCFASGSTKPGSPCLRCAPDQNAAGWTSAATNTPCNDGNACSSDDHCDAAGQCVGDTSCDDGVACTQDVCTAGGCSHSAVTSGWCRIGSTCYSNNTTNPTNVCQRCNPSASQTAWSPQPSSAACSDGNACTAGDHCDGQGSCTPGPTCSDGLTCTTDSCNPAVGCSYPVAAGKCKINDACYSNGETQPGNACYACNAGASSSAWSLNNGASCSDGNSCTSGDVCSGGGCAGAPNVDAYEANASLAAAWGLHGFGNLGIIGDGDGWPDDAKTLTANLYPDGR